MSWEGVFEFLEGKFRSEAPTPRRKMDGGSREIVCPCLFAKHKKLESACSRVSSQVSAFLVTTCCHKEQCLLLAHITQQARLTDNRRDL